MTAAITPPPRSVARLLLLAFVLLGIFFNQFLCSLSGIPQLSVIDELPLLIFPLVCLVQLVTRKTIHRFAAYLLAAYLILLGVSLFSPYVTASKAAIQMLIHLRLFIYYYLASLFLPPRLSRLILRTLILITAAGMLINLFLQEGYNRFFDVTPLYRYGMLRPLGFQLNVNNLAFTLALFVTGYLFALERPALFQKRLVWSLVALIFFGVLTGSRTILVFAPIVLFFFSILS